MATPTQADRRQTAAALRPRGPLALLDSAAALYRRCFLGLWRGWMGGAVAVSITLVVLANLWAADLSRMDWGQLLPFAPGALASLPQRLLLGLPARAAEGSAVHVGFVAALTSATLARVIPASLGPAGGPWLARRGRRRTIPTLALGLLLAPLTVIPLWIAGAAEAALMDALSYGPASGKLWENVAVVAGGQVPQLLLTLALLLGLTPPLLAVPAAALENLTARAALARAWRLARGAYLRGVALLLLVCGVQGLLAAAPFGVLWLSWQIPEEFMAATQTVSTVATQLIEVLAFPLLPAALLALYVDQRVRQEGFREEIDRAAASEQRLEGLHERLSECWTVWDTAGIEEMVGAILVERPDDMRALTMRTVARLSAGAPRDALEDARRLTATYPRYAYAYALRGTCRAALGDSAGAARDARKAQRRNRRLGMEIEQRADDCIEHEHVPLALSYTTTLVLLMPRNARAHYNRACALSRLGRAEEAIEELGLAISMDVGHRADALADRDFDSLRGDPRVAALLG